jgi:hypothetical protein
MACVLWVVASARTESEQAGGLGLEVPFSIVTDESTPAAKVRDNLLSVTPELQKEKSQIDIPPPN